MRNLRCAVSALTIAAAAANPAFAQRAPSAQQDRVPPQPSETSSEIGIQDIVVTASRRAENVQKAALSIQALSAEDLIRANISKPEDLSNIATGVQIGTSGAYPQVYIRGVGTYATQVFAESGIAFNLDGVYISRPWATRGIFYDLDRVEVLKGPQGTLYGRNASGGAINVITAKPKLGIRSGFVEIQAGNYSAIQAATAVNLPIGDTAAIRASGKIVSRDGYLSDGLDDDKTQSARLQLRWEPTSDISLLVSGNYQHVEGRGPGSVLSPRLNGKKFGAASDPAVQAIIQAEPGIGPLLAYPKDDGFINVTVKAIAAEINWNFGPATLTILPSYRDSEQHTRHYVSGFGPENAEHNRQTTLEVRLGHDNDKLKWVLGGYFFDEQTTPLDGYPSLYVLQGLNTQIQSNLDLTTRSYAAFGQATFSLSDRLRVTGGLRYTHERKRDDEVSVYYNLPNQASGGCAVGAFDPTAAAPLLCRFDLPIHQTVTFSNVTWKAGVEIDVAQHSMAYLTASTGFKSGGLYTAPPPSNSFAPEKLTALEIGIKNRFLDNRLQVNLDAFYWIYRDHQESYVGPTSLPNLLSFVTVNAGKAKSYGADLDMLYLPTDADEISLKVQYNKSRFNTFTMPVAFGIPVTGCTVVAQVIDCSGKPLLRAPKWAGNVGYAHSFDLGDSGTIRTGFDTQFATGSYLSIDFLQAARQKSYAVGNFNLTWTNADGRLTVSAFVDNIWNEEIKNQANRYSFVSPANPLAGRDGVIFATVRPPRTFGGRLRVNF